MVPLARQIDKKNSLIHSSIFDMWPTEEARGGPGRARSVAEGRERDDFWIQKSLRDELFTLFCIFKGKVRKRVGKKGGGTMMDFFTLERLVSMCYNLWGDLSTSRGGSLSMSRIHCACQSNCTD